MYYKDKDYKNIFYLVRNHKLADQNKYQELLPYEEILYNIFKDIKNLNNIEEYVKEIIGLIKKIPDPLYNLDSSIIEYCKAINYSNRIHAHQIFEYLEAIFLPKESPIDETSYSIGYYLNTLDQLLNYNIGDIEFHFNYEKFNKLYEYFNNIPSYPGVYFNMDIIKTLLASVYMNDYDYSIVDEYISDVYYYNDIIKTMGIIINDNNKGNYYSMMYKRLFENANKIFNKNKKLIK